VLSVFNVIRFHYSTTGFISLPEPADMSLTCSKVEFYQNFIPGDVWTNVPGLYAESVHLLSKEIVVTHRKISVRIIE
jgi:hypothetical protein